MKTISVLAGVLAVLVATPALSQPSNDSDASLDVLCTIERDSLKDMLRSTDNATDRDALHADIEERARKQALLNDQLGGGYRNLLTTEEQQAIRERLAATNDETTHKAIIAEAQALAQSKLRFRATNAYSLHDNSKVATRNAAGKYVPLP